MTLTKDEYKIIIEILENVNCTVRQAKKLLEIIDKLKFCMDSLDANEVRPKRWLSDGD